MSPFYGAWELKASYQRYLSFGFVSSLLVVSVGLLAIYFLSRVGVFPSDKKTHTVRVKLTSPVFSPPHF